MRFVLIAFLLWRGALFAVDMVGLNLFREHPNPHKDYSAFQDPPRHFWNSFARWDSGWYMRIAERGYYIEGHQNATAFFPGFPYAARLLGKVIGDHWTAGLIVSNVCLLIGLFFLYGIARRYLDDDGAERAVIFTLTFPMTFLFSCYYSEGLFFMAVAGAFYFYERDRFLPAALFGALAAFTRATGILLLPALLIGAVHRVGWRPSKLSVRFLWLFLIAGGLLAFMWMLAKEPRVNDAMAWVKAQAGWGRESKLPFAALYDEAIKRPWPWSPVDPWWGTGLILGWFGVFVIWGAAVYALRRLDIAHALFAGACVVLPLMSGRTLSMNRFALGVPAVFVVMALVSQGRPLVTRGFIIAGSLLAAVVMIGFATWRFVG